MMNYEYSVMLIGDGHMEEKIDTDSLQRLHDFITNLPIKNLEFKPHPGGEVIEVNDAVESLESWRPVELYFGSCRMVVGNCSYALVTAAKSGLISISCINVVEFLGEGRYTFWYSYLNRESGGWVLFPKSFRSLELMLC